MSTWLQLQEGFKTLLQGTLDPDNLLNTVEALALQEISSRARRDFVESVSILSQEKYFIKMNLRSSYRTNQSPLFPPPTGVNVNMMPFQLTRCKETLPEELHGYIALIQNCMIPKAWRRRCMYITIQESFVKRGECQRRPGLHIERPLVTGGGRVLIGPQWGGGYHDKDADMPVDGIYMASTVPGSCRVFPVAVEDPASATDAHGGVEHLRARLGPGVDVDGLVWLTDRTPHESLPAKEDGYRQFFRVCLVRGAQHGQPGSRGGAGRAHLARIQVPWGCVVIAPWPFKGHDARTDI